MKIPVARLIRVSTEGQAGEDRFSIPAQRRACADIEKQYGLTPIENGTFEIVDVSGAMVLSSPEMQRLISLVQSGQIKGVVAKELSRLIRPDSFFDLAFLQTLADHRVLIYLPDGPIDMATRPGWLMAGIRAMVAGLERSEIKQRMQDAKEAMRRTGRHPGGATTLPFGVTHDRKKGRWEYSPEASKVRALFDAVLRGETCYENLAARLNIPRTNIRFMLSNPIYSGWLVYDQKRDPSPGGYVPRPGGRQGYRKKIPRRPEEVIRCQVLDPPLVSAGEFEAVQQIVAAKASSHQRARTQNPSRYAYRGFLVCGACGAPLYTHTPSRNEFYACKSRHSRVRKKRAALGLKPCTNRYMLRRKVEAKVDEAVRTRLCCPELVVRAYEALLEHLSRATPALPDTGAQLAELERKRQRIIECYVDGVIDAVERDRRLTEVEREITSYSRIEPAKAVDRGVSERDLVKLAQVFSEWAFLTVPQRRRILTLLEAKFEVYRYGLKGVHLTLPMPEDGGDTGSRRPAAGA